MFGLSVLIFGCSSDASTVEDEYPTTSEAAIGAIPYPALSAEVPMHVKLFFARINDSGTNRKAPCSFIVHTWALKELPYQPYHNFGVYVYTPEV